MNYCIASHYLPQLFLHCCLWSVLVRYRPQIALHYLAHILCSLRVKRWGSRFFVLLERFSRRKLKRVFIKVELAQTAHSADGKWKFCDSVVSNRQVLERTQPVDVFWNSNDSIPSEVEDFEFGELQDLSGVSAWIHFDFTLGFGFYLPHREIE